MDKKTLQNVLQTHRATLEKLESAYMDDRPLRSAVDSIGGDSSLFPQAVEAFQSLYTILEEIEYNALAHLDVEESADITDLKRRAGI